MLDFNHRPSFTERVSELIDQALCAEHKAQPDRDYLGASRLGENCSRKLQYEYANTPKDEGFSGQTLRIFAAGHVFEDLAIRWLRLAGFEVIESVGVFYGLRADGSKLTAITGQDTYNANDFDTWFITLPGVDFNINEDGHLIINI